MSFIKIGKDQVVVTVNDFIKHDGYLQRIGTLSRTLHAARADIKGKKLIFYFPDGEPVTYTAVDRVLKKMISDLELDQSQVIFKMVDHWPLLTSDWATVEIYPSPFFKNSRDLIDYDLCTLGENPKLFGGIYGRFSHSRFLMAYFLEKEFPDDSFVIFQPGQDFVDFEMSPSREMFAEELEWSKSRIDNRTLEGIFNGCISYRESLPNYHELFSKYLIEVVIETNTVSEGWFTEKTCRCLASGKPFLLYGAPGQIARLQEMGFRTFHPMIDESYDNIKDHEMRFDMICCELKNIHHSSHSISFFQELESIANWNRDNYQMITKRYYNDYSN